VRQIPGLDPDVQERAGLTDRQAECLDLHLRGASYRYIARAIGVLQHVTAREHVQVAVAKVERAMREGEPVRVEGPGRSNGAGASRARSGVDPFA
jgi:hypothetical protein